MGWSVLMGKCSNRLILAYEIILALELRVLHIMFSNIWTLIFLFMSVIYIYNCYGYSMTYLEIIQE